MAGKQVKKEESNKEPQKQSMDKNIEENNVNDIPEGIFTEGLETLQAAQELRKLQEEKENLKEQCLRAYADSDNIRKRAEKEISDVRKYAISSLIKDLIDVVEALYDSTEHITTEYEENGAIKKIVEGVGLTRKKLMDILIKNNVKRVVPAIGDPFDHNYQQALSQVPNDKYSKNSVIEVIRAGYLIEDRLIKPALVVVSAGVA